MKTNSGFVGLIILVVIAVAITIGGTVLVKNYQEGEAELASRQESVRKFIADIDSSPSPKEIQKTNTQPSLTPTPKPTTAIQVSSSRLTSYGTVTIEDGATVQITSLSEVGTSLKIHIVFSNPSSLDKTVGPLRTSMRSGKYGYAPNPPPSPITLSSGQRREFDFTYTPDDDSPPYRFVYSNFNGVQVDLGEYK